MVDVVNINVMYFKNLMIIAIAIILVAISCKNEPSKKEGNAGKEDTVTTEKNLIVDLPAPFATYIRA
jgi:hypothetical protein